MAPAEGDGLALLPAPFLRGLEGDLRSMCADAKRINPSLKDVAERVILQLKEADSPAASAAAASAAAEAFCEAATPLDSNSATSAAIAAHNRVVVRAVSCLHKLLTHRAVAAARLAPVVDALELLAIDPTMDDSVTLKVLQAVLSMLTVRAYVCALPQDQLARAFSLLFKLRTRNASAAVGAGAGALSAISAVAVPKVEPDEFGVIEVTAQAAFRQVASDLFAAAGAAVASEESPHQSINGLPPVVAAAYALFQDMCAVMADDSLLWLDLGERRVQPVLALEVMDDGVSGNVDLFDAEKSPVFSSLLSSRLCPGVHEMLRSDIDRPVYKALFGLTVTVVTRLWKDLGPDTEVLLSCVVRLMDVPNPSEPSWAAVYAVESLRAIVRGVSSPSSKAAEEAPIFVSLFEVFDMRSRGNQSDGGSRVMANVLRAVCESGLSCFEGGKADSNSPAIASLSAPGKPFSVSESNRVNVFVASAAGVCLAYCEAVEHVAEANLSTDMALAMMSGDTVKLVTKFMNSLVLEVPCLDGDSGGNSGSAGSSQSSAHVSLIKGYTRILRAADKVGAADARLAAVSSLASCASSALARLTSEKTTELKTEATRVIALYEGLFESEKVCGENFGAAWRSFVDAAHVLDVALHSDSRGTPDNDKSGVLSSGSAASAALAPLKADLEEAFAHASKLSWAACNELVSALVVSSRLSLAAITKSAGLDDTTTSKASSELRIFGIARAETVMTGIFVGDAIGETEVMPQGLWQLLTGHLVAIASDSEMKGMRVTAIGSLVRVSACALESKVSHLLPQDTVIAPISDLLSSVHLDTREGCLDAVYKLLETRGEFIKESRAWDGILSILKSACGDEPQMNGTGSDSSGAANVRKNGIRGSGTEDVSSVPNVSTDVEKAGEAMVQRGFRVVQLIADDFIPFLAFETLSNWTSVLLQYGKQSQDVNVALTAVGLIWRTADHFAKHSGERVYDSLWMNLFEVLKALGSDERPEVRNGAVKTLTSTLTAHGTKLAAAAWKGCVERALLPLLEEVMEGSGSESREALSGRTKGDAQLVLHHSRDTPRKQWNETRVLALGGVASVLRKAIPELADSRDEADRPLIMMLVDGGSTSVWAKILLSAGRAACSAEREVSLAGVGALLELLNASGSVQSQEAFSSSAMLWDAVWVAIDKSLGGETSEGQSEELAGITNEKALVTLVRGLGVAREELASSFTSKSSMLFLSILRRLVAGNPSGEVQSASTASPPSSSHNGHLSEVQDAAICVVEVLSFDDDSETWSALVSVILRLIEAHRNVASSALMYRLVHLIEALYEGDSLPRSIKVTMLHEVVETLAPVMCDSSLESGRAMSYVDNDRISLSGTSGTLPSEPLVDWRAAGLSKDLEPLWVVAVCAFANVLFAGLDAGSPTTQLWKCLPGVAFRFLYGTGRVMPDTVLDPRAREALAFREVFDIKVAHCIRKALVSANSDSVEAFQKKLFDVLARGAEEGMRGSRPKFVRGCQSCVFSLADSSASVHVNIASEAAACVVRVSDFVLKRFVADGQRAGKCPLPAERRAETVFLLRRLQTLRLSPDGEDSRRHLKTLHPRLCECSDGSDEAVRLLAQLTIQSAGA